MRFISSRLSLLALALLLSFTSSAFSGGGEKKVKKTKKETTKRKKVGATTPYTEEAGESKTIRWDQTKWSFGDQPYGAEIKHSYTFINNGTKPVTISNVIVGCGCTASDYTKQVIQPGKTGTVTATYNDNTKPGTFNKNLTVKFNNGDNVLLWFDGTVMPKE